MKAIEPHRHIEHSRKTHRRSDYVPPMYLCFYVVKNNNKATPERKKARSATSASPRETINKTHLPKELEQTHNPISMDQLFLKLARKATRTE